MSLNSMRAVAMKFAYRKNQWSVQDKTRMTTTREKKEKQKNRKEEKKSHCRTSYYGLFLHRIIGWNNEYKFSIQSIHAARSWFFLFHVYRYHCSLSACSHQKPILLCEIIRSNLWMTKLNNVMLLYYLKEKRESAEKNVGKKWSRGQNHLI